VGAGESEESGEVGHVGGEEEVGVMVGLEELTGQGDGAAVHAPFPEAAGEGEELEVVGGVLLVAFGPGLVAATVVGGEEGDVHRVEKGLTAENGEGAKKKVREREKEREEESNLTDGKKHGCKGG
jgi:hypothetical protein